MAIPYRNDITDFRYNTARIDGITNLFNGSLIVISNGYYWILEKGQKPLIQNIKGRISELYNGFKRIDAIWIDPYNDISQQIYLISNTVEHGLRVVCQEFDEKFSQDSKFCHLPVDKSWRNALRDLDLTKPIDAATWRNRTKNQDGGFWVFFQGKIMITIDPYEMNLRYTYDMEKWMSINNSLTAAFYDFHQSVYHFFFDNNKYFTWKVNVSYMNSLPMTWDRAFLHGSLSEEKKINRDFFGFPEWELKDEPQPYYIKIFDDQKSINSLTTKNYPTPSTISQFRSTISLGSKWKKSNGKYVNLSDVEYIKSKKEQLYIFKMNDKSIKKEKNRKDFGQSETNLINYQKQLMQLEREGVRDFSSSKSSSSIHSHYSVINFSTTFQPNKSMFIFINTYLCACLIYIYC